MGPQTSISDPIAASLPVVAPSTRQLAVSGTLWTVLGYGASQFLRLISNLILTRLLAPSVFGAMALVQVVLQGLAMFSDLGIGPSVIRAKGDDPVFLNTAWTVQFCRGWVLWAACIILAYPIARFYQTPQLTWLIIVCGVGAVLGGVQSIAMFTENKKMAIKRLTVLQLSAQVIGLVVMIALAIAMRSIWALVIGGLVAALCTTVFSHLFLSGVPTRFRWHGESFNELFHFGKWIFVSTILGFVSAQLDRIMLGKLVSLSVLGVYSIALTLSALPKNVIGQLSGVVVFPVYARYAHAERAEFASKVIKARGLLLPAAAVLTAGLVTLSPPFFHWLYDSRYADAAWMSQCFAIYMWFWILETSVSPALLAIGSTFPLSVCCFTNIVFTVIGCLIGYKIAGMLGFILGLSLSTITHHLVMQIALFRHGINIYRQDLLFTGGTIILTGISLLVGWSTTALFPMKWQHVAGMITPNLVILAAGLAIAQFVVIPSLKNRTNERPISALAV